MRDRQLPTYAVAIEAVNRYSASGSVREIGPRGLIRGERQHSANSLWLRSHDSKSATSLVQRSLFSSAMAISFLSQGKIAQLCQPRAGWFLGRLRRGGEGDLAKARQQLEILAGSKHLMRCVSKDERAAVDRDVAFVRERLAGAPAPAGLQ